MTVERLTELNRPPARDALSETRIDPSTPHERAWQPPDVVPAFPYSLPNGLRKNEEKPHGTFEANRFGNTWRAEQVPLASATGRAVQVLIVDDEPSVTLTLSRCLEREGYDCAVAASAKEALRRLDETTFDVLVTDARLPMMSGIDLLKTAKVRDPGIQVIVMTGCRDIDFAVEAIRSRVNDYLVKPFDLDQLSQAVAVCTKAGVRYPRALCRRSWLYQWTISSMARNTQPLRIASVSLKHSNPYRYISWA